MRCMSSNIKSIIIIRTSTGFSGAEIYTLNLIHQIQLNSKYKCTLITNNRTLHKLAEESVYIADGLKEVGTKKEFFIFLFSYYKYIPYYSLVLQLRLQGKNIILLTSTNEKIALTLLLKMLGYKIFWLEHGPFFSHTYKFKFIEYLYTFLSRFVTKIITVSKDSQKNLVTHGIRTSITTCYLGIPLPKKVTLSYLSYGDIRSIGFVSSLTKEKGIADFIDIATYIHNRTKAIVFSVYGDGPEMPYLIEQQKKNPAITIHGFIPNMARVYHTLDILLFPTHHSEGLPMTIMEALAHGILVIAKDSPALRELITHKRNGLLYTNRQELIALIEEVVSHPKAYTAIVDQAHRDIASAYNIERNCATFLHVFD